MDEKEAGQGTSSSESKLPIEEVSSSATARWRLGVKDTVVRLFANRQVTEVLVLLVIVGFGVVVNIIWISKNLRGMPFDIDVAGYLQRAIRDGDALSARGLGSFISTVRTPNDPEAPLLTALAGLFRGIGGFDTLKMTTMLQGFYVVTLVSSYAIARKVMGSRWSMLGVVVIGSIPTILQTSRDFEFALPATALLTSTVAAQLYAANFQSIFRSLGWGALLGLTTLTRTLMVAFIPVLIVVLLPRLFRGSSRPRRLLNFVLALALAMLVAASWYSVTWHSVLNYLTGYGYGSGSISYGQASSWFSLHRWTFRLNFIVNANLFAPLTAALAFALVVGVISAAVRRSKPYSARGVMSPTQRLARAKPHKSTGLSDLGTLGVLLAISYILLTSTRNVGSYFELPFLPIAVIAVLGLASRAGRSARFAVCSICGIAAIFSFINQAGWFLGDYSTVKTVQVGAFNMVAFDSRGILIRYASEAFGGCPSIYSCVAPQVIRSPNSRASDVATVNRFIRSWEAPVVETIRIIRSYSAIHDRSPVVFLAVQDPFFNTNTLALQAQISGFSLPLGLLEPQGREGPSLIKQLELPQFGLPNFVIEGPLPTDPFAASFSPRNYGSTVVTALRTDGFLPIQTVRLPDHRRIRIWWKDLGAVSR